MASAHYSKSVTFPTHQSITNTAIIVGNPISTAFDAAHLTFVHEMISLFLRMESDIAAKGFDYLTVVNNGHALENHFLADKTAFLATPILTAQSNSNSSNQKIPLARRCYKYETEHVDPLYFRVDVGLIGLSSTSIGTPMGRPYADVTFSSDAAFLNVIDSVSLCSLASTSVVYGSLSGYSVKLSYTINDSSLAIYPLGLLRNSTFTTDTLGRSATGTTPINLPIGFIVSSANLYGALSPVQKIAVALTPPVFIGYSTESTTQFVPTGNAANYISKPPCIVTRELTETRCVFSLGCSGSVTPAPSRKFASQYTHTLSTGDVLIFDDLLIVSDPLCERLDFTEGTYQLAGNAVSAYVQPFLMPFIPSCPAWLSRTMTYVLGVKK